MNPLEDYTVRIRRYHPTDPRLGRHVRHDSRSLLFQAPPADPAALVSTRHLTHIPTLDQGQIGSCTGNAATKALSYADLWAAGMRVLSPSDAGVDEDYAVGVYSDGTKIDPYRGTYPPDDTGSDGLSVAKVLQSRGLINGYTHATSLSAVLGALMQRAVITGTKWTAGMYDVTSAGELLPTGATEGGHEYVLDQVDVERRRIWMQNSWSDAWGQGGRAWFSYDAYESLLADDGDATVFNPVAAPAPEPAAYDVGEFVRLGDAWARVPRVRADNKAMQAAWKAWRRNGSPAGM